MRGGTAVHAETLHHALEALAFRDADHVDDLAFLEDRIARDHVARLHVGGSLEAHFTEVGVRLDAGLLEMAERGLRQALLLLFAEGELHRVVTVLVGGLHLHDRAGTRLDDGDGDKRVVAVINLGHAQLGSQKCVDHFSKR